MQEEYRQFIEYTEQLYRKVENEDIKAEIFPTTDFVKMVFSMLISSEMVTSWEETLLLLNETSFSKTNLLSLLRIAINLLILEGRTVENFILQQTQEFQLNAKKAYDNHYKKQQKETKVFTGRGVVYTVITGDYDELKDPEYVIDGIDYICFTDSLNKESKIWKFVELKKQSLTERQLSRHPKILPHLYLEEYDYSIYIDTKLVETGDLRDYVGRYEKASPMLCFPHFIRDCAYDEAEECVKQGKETKENVEKQMNAYRAEGFPEHIGLIDAACMVRKHNDPIVKSTMETWWSELIRWDGKRDQLSFNYACWKNNFNYDICDLFTNQNPYLKKRRKGELPI